MRWLAALFAALLPFAASGQQYPFLPVAGSPLGAKKLFQDSNDRLWIAAVDLTCYDGTRFFNLHDYGLPSLNILDLTEDKSGAIWIGADSGLYRFRQGRVEEIAKGSFHSIVVVEPDIIVALVGPGGRTEPQLSVNPLIRVEKSGTGWKAETVLTLDSAGPLTLDGKGTLLYPRPGKGWGEIRSVALAHWHSGQRLAVRQFEVPDFPANGHLKAMRDQDGCTWLGASGGGGGAIFLCGNRSPESPLQGIHLDADFHQASDGTMILWGGSSLAMGNKKGFRIATSINGLPALADAIRARDGTIWLASSSGLYRFPSPFQLEYWEPRNGMSSPPWSFARSRGKVYAGVDQAIMNLTADGRSWELTASFRKGGSVTSLLAGWDGSLLTSFIGGGAVQVDARGREIARTQSLPAPPNIMRLTRTPDDQVWLAGGSLSRLVRQGKVWRLEAHPLETQPPRNGLAIKYEPHTHQLWSCYSGGAVVRDEHDQWREITTRDGLLSNSCWSLAPLASGDVWYVYFDAPAIALIRKNADGRYNVRSYGRNEGLEDPISNTMDLDQYGNLWRTGARAIYLATPEQAEAGKWLRLDQSDGFPASDINTGSYFNDPDGSLWWGGDNDAVHYSPPPDIAQPKFAPKVFLSAFSWDGEQPKLAEAVHELPHTASLVAHIGSLQFDRRHALRIRYRVLPGQINWRESNSLEVPLGPLSSGPHTLEVQGRVFTGPWSGSVIRSFHVATPIWFSSRLLIFYLLAATMLLAAAFLLRRRRHWDEQALLPDLAQWRMSAVMPDECEFTGTILDNRFEIGELIGRGGFASVMSGYDRTEQQLCAIKIFRGEVNRASTRSGFEREVVVLRQIRHPNVVAIYADGYTASGTPYLAMEIVEGENLRAIVQTGPLNAARIARLLSQLASALDAIHERGICHRDLKPENVLVRHSGQANEEAVLIDFSIAIIKDANETLHGLSRAAGTFDYMAPEQAMGHAQPGSDIFSLAKIAIELLTGTRVTLLLPDAALNLPERIPEVLRKFDYLSEDSITMLASALSFDPGKRPGVASQFVMPIVRDLHSSGAAL